PAMSFDLVVWLAWADLVWLWPSGRGGWGKKAHVVRAVRPWRLFVASALFVLLGLAVFSATGTGS
ncbi:MAG TPA: hypothetical protein VFG86_16120, partial [Chloroflexota bacterium]|nr:hypothetical protein [Chloroflexota bacterium]